MPRLRRSTPDRARGLQRTVLERQQLPATLPEVESGLRVGIQVDEGSRFTNSHVDTIVEADVPQEMHLQIQMPFDDPADHFTDAGIVLLSVLVDDQLEFEGPKLPLQDQPLLGVQFADDVQKKIGVRYRGMAVPLFRIPRQVPEGVTIEGLPYFAEIDRSDQTVDVFNGGRLRCGYKNAGRGGHEEIQGIERRSGAEIQQNVIERQFGDMTDDLQLPLVGKIGDVQGVHRAADQKKIRGRRLDNCFGEARAIIPDEVGQAPWGMRDAGDRVQIGGAEVQIDQQGPETLLREDHPEGPRQEALPGAAFAPADRPYPRHTATP